MNMIYIVAPETACVSPQHPFYLPYMVEPSGPAGLGSSSTEF